MVADVDIGNFDEPRVGRAAARAAFAEVRRLARADDRVVSTRRRRRSRRLVEVTITVEAPSAIHAVELAGTVLRTGIHATGGSTAGWDDIRCDLRAAPRRAGRRRPRDQTPASMSWAALAKVDTDEWALAGQRARHLDRLQADLPPLVGAVIDLR